MNTVPTDTEEQRETLQWVSHPVKERPLAAMFLFLIMLLASYAAMVFMENIWWGAIGFALLFLSLWSFFLPVKYTMDSKGVRKKSPFGEEVKGWSEVRSIVEDSYGVLLSPFKQPTRLAKFRGLSIQFSGNREEVLEFIRSRTGS